MADNLLESQFFESDSVRKNSSKFFDFCDIYF